MQTLYMDLKVGETVTVGGVMLTLEQKSGQLAKLRFQHEGVDIRRTPDRRAAVRDESRGRRSTDSQ